MFDPNNPAGGSFSDDPVEAAEQYVARFLDRVFVYAGPLDLGGFTRRAAIVPLQNRPLLNVWMGESDEPGQATLKRL